MSSLTHNVHRLERAVSLATGLTAIVAGVSRGGAGGVLKALGGAVLVQRGLTGHCVVKGMVSDPKAEIECLRQRIADMRAALPKVHEQSAASRAPHQESKLDHAVEETFPASDPISP
ncbi:DUF2892 domain-containing protein [Pseudomonas sp. GOM7]|uniref:YgaP family membrane protein n=1 Tax=unclassified Pseudomonas TaxID=196821 RepID=UPI00227C8E29|nr:MULTISPECIES: DUF2892 domain-containing protein [unclassified Pseudomonas]WAJ39856.1 DUF2892 domain-containing protein [Pseudomonas sp. GOM7]